MLGAKFKKAISFGKLRRSRTPQASQCAQGKVIGIHHRLISFIGHRYTEALGSVEEYTTRSRKVVLFISSSAKEEIAASLGAKAVLDDPTFHPEWSFNERTARFVAMLHQHITPIVEADDRVFLTVATQLETNALAHWLLELPQKKKPWVIATFLSDRWNRKGPEEYNRQAAEFSILKKTLAGLGAIENHKLILYFGNESTELSEELEAFIDRPVGVIPMPLRYVFPEREDSPVTVKSKRLPVVALMGGLRMEKGSALIPDIFSACRSLVNVSFSIHMVPEAMEASAFERVKALSNEATVNAIFGELDVEEYARVIQNSDILMLPYQVIPYRYRQSGILGEAAAYGKPVIVPDGTGLAKPVREGRIAGVICKDLSAQGYANAIAECVANLPELTARAQSLSKAWVESVSMSAFVDIIEDEIASREQLPLVEGARADSRKAMS